MIHEKIEIQLKDSEFKADLFTYFLDNSPEIDMKRKRPVVVICPGGGYHMTSDREAEAIALKFVGMGYHAAVLRYSVEPALFPESLLQLAKAVALLRSIPKAHEKGCELQAIPGTPPDLMDPPQGCPFAARCKETMIVCQKYMPDYTDCGKNHKSACWTTPGCRWRQEVNSDEK